MTGHCPVRLQRRAVVMRGTVRGRLLSGHHELVTPEARLPQELRLVQQPLSARVSGMHCSPEGIIEGRLPRGWEAQERWRPSSPAAMVASSGWGVEEGLHPPPLTFGPFPDLGPKRR